MATQNISVISGVVETTNQNGFKISGRQDWINYSQFGYHGPRYTPNTPAPFVGQTVTCELKNDKFLNKLVVDGVATATQRSDEPHPEVSNYPMGQPAQFAPTALAATHAGTQQSLLERTIETRLKLINTLAVAQPALFALDQIEELSEIVRNLEQFVLEDLIEANKPNDDDEPIEDEPLDEAV